jgi:3-phytase
MIKRQRNPGAVDIEPRLQRRKTPRWCRVAYSFATLASLVVFGLGCPPEPLVPIVPLVVTDPVAHDGDDPAIWVNQVTPADSRILATDKDLDGAIYVFDLQGHEIPANRVYPLSRPNNIDVEYGLDLDGTPVDIAVVTERLAHQIRVYQLPDMTPIDGGGIPVFVGQTNRECMGIGLYKRPGDGKIFAIVSRADGPSGSYLWQYELDGTTGTVTGTFSRSFGAFTGLTIESIAVDDALGFVYYSDEGAGIRKYHADPADGEAELALFGTDDFTRDSEGISVYELDATTGYLLVSDQQADLFHVYPREGDPGHPNRHTLVKTVALSTAASDGSDVTSLTLVPGFPGGLFVAMSSDRTFQMYSWEQIASAPGTPLLVRP